jgi:myosin heavy subunit
MTVGMNDMIYLGELTEVGIMDNLRERYVAEIVYVIHP